MEGNGRGGRKGIWPTQKFWCGAPLLCYACTQSVCRDVDVSVLLIVDYQSFITGAATTRVWRHEFNIVLGSCSLLSVHSGVNASWRSTALRHGHCHALDLGTRLPRQRRLLLRRSYSNNAFIPRLGFCHFCQDNGKQDSWAIAKKTARCTQYMGALKSFESPHYAPGYFSRNM